MIVHPPIHPAWLDVDLWAIERNASLIIGRAGVPLIPMLKGDAYGMGAVAVAHSLESLKPWAYGVSSPEEGIELRRSGIQRRIILFTPIVNPQIRQCVDWNLSPALGRPAIIEEWAETSRPWHLQIDTGMSRAGMMWHDVRLHGTLLSRVRPDSVFTHYHSAELDGSARNKQDQRFQEALTALPFRPDVVHTENSAAVQRIAPSSHTVIRAGIFLYGVPGFPESPLTPFPVATIKARIAEIRTVATGETVSYGGTWRAPSRTALATVPVGYADGYPRRLSNRGTAILHGKPIRVAGRVTMDMTVFDVTNTKAKVGDYITILGADGGRFVSIADLARTAQLSPYEVLTALKLRLPRNYTHSGT